MSTNGKLSPSMLATVQGSIQLAAPAALAFKKMQAAAEAAGRKIAIPIDGGYRDWDVQERMYANRARYLPIRIAPPGMSTHGDGLCVDIIGDLAWAVANSTKFGLYRPMPTADPHHFRFNAALIPAGSNETPIDEEAAEDEDEMTAVRETFIRNSGDNTIYWEREPGAPLYPLSPTEYLWLGSPAYLDLSHAQVTAWVIKNGMAVTLADAHAPRPGTSPIDNTSVLDAIGALSQAVAEVPARVILEQKKPGN